MNTTGLGFRAWKAVAWSTGVYVIASLPLIRQNSGRGDEEVFERFKPVASGAGGSVGALSPQH